MEEKKLNGQESLAIITEMIDRTKNRLHMGDGNMLLLWGYLTVIVTSLVWVLFHLYRHPAVMYLFFLIWIIGGIASHRIETRSQVRKGAVTYTDRISQSVWTMVGLIAIALTFICLGFMLFGGYNCWNAMYVYPMLVIGMAECFEGFIIHEKSMVCGGSVGILFGLVSLAMVSGGVMLSASWFFPAFIFSFICMLIIPGHILNHKAKRLCSRN